MADDRRACAYCPEPGADVCVREHNSVCGGDGSSVYAHRACAEAHGVPVLYALLGTVGAEHCA